MIGIAFILGNSGWACSNEAHYEARNNSARMPDRSIKITPTLELKLISIFGTAIKGESVQCLFKSDDTNLVQGFSGVVSANENSIVHVKVLGTIDNTKELYLKLKKIGGN